MNVKYFSKALAMLLAVVMIAGLLPMNAFAALVDYESRDDEYYNLISKQDWELAPGVVESEIVLNNDAGSHRQVAHVVEVDINNPYTKVMPSTYKMAEGLKAKDYKVQTMSQQAAYAEANGYGNVVAAMNIALSWYDSDYYDAHPELVGEPLGYLVLDGEVYKNSQGQSSGAQTVLVINFDEKDGVARPADMPKTEIRSTKDAITGWEEQVIPANFGFLVKDGKNQYAKNHTSDPASRSFIGIKADGTIVMVMNDGRQSPYSAGFNSYEMAEFMLSLGCVQAVNGDGGGSSAFLSQRPGEELKVNCRPSDGAERETTHGILVISTAPATGEFVRATISSEEDYYTPGSAIQFSAIGTDLVGTAAEIPADVVWQLEDDSFGTIDQNGRFVSNGKQGAVKVQMVYNGEVVGEDTIYIVMPDKLAFAQANMVVPFGKSVDVGLIATYDSKNVVLKPEDVSLTLDNSGIGYIDGFNFFAAEEGASTTTAILTAVVGEVSANTNLSLGKGTEIVYDFENQDLTGWSIFTNYGQYGPKGPNGNVKDENGNYWYHGQNERGEINIVDSTTGKVRNGRYALAVECDFTQIFETGYQALNLFFPKIDTTDAIAVGFWLYVPYDARHAQLTIAGGGFDNGELFNLNEGWHYVTAVPRADNTWYHVNISVDDRACSSTGNYYDYVNEANLNGKYTFYIDDISIDYSTAVEDRENPVFGNISLLGSNDTITALDGKLVTVNTNSPMFEVRVEDDASSSNVTGLNANSAQAYIDGKAVSFTYQNGKFTVNGVKLSDGVHEIRFAISDNAGNASWVGAKILVATGTDTSSTVKVVPQNPNADRLLIGSLYWMDVIATDIETVDKVEMTFDLNNGSSWELEGLTVAEGFSASWAVQEDDNIATIVIERTGKNTATGEAVLASFPVRTWVSTTTQYEGYEHMDPAWLVNYGCVWKKSVELTLERGIITYVEGYENDTTGTFGMEDLEVVTECFFTNYTRLSVEGAQEWLNEHKAAGIGWHEHTSEAVADCAPTCTKAGYTGRTYCAVCDSVVDWGTVVPAIDHSYEVVDGQLVCECGEIYTGSGLVEINGKAYYITNDNLVSGWLMIGEDWYYFDKTTFAGLDGERAADGHIKYAFEMGRVTTGTWETTEAGIRYWYGPTYYRDTTNDTKSSKPVVIDGKTYLFNRQGYMQTGLVHSFVANGVVYYNCDENGVATLLNGPFGDYLYIDGTRQTRYKLIKVEGSYYFVDEGDKILKNKRVYLSSTFVSGKTFPDGRIIQPGYYEFDADGKMVIPELKNGVVGDYLYINDIKQTRYKLVEFEGNYYFVDEGDKILKNKRVYLSSTFVSGKTFPDGRTIQPGYYEFDAEGKMVIPELKNGVVGDYLYINDVKQTKYKLIEFEGSYYFVDEGDKILKNKRVYLSNTFVSGKTFSDGRAIQPGYYEFDANGKMIIPERKHGVVGDYLYINDVKQTKYKLIEFEGSYYFVDEGDKILKNKRVYLSSTFVSGKTFPDGRAIQPGYYEFDANGKLVIPELKNGVIGDYLYINDVKQTRYKLVEFEGNFYFVDEGDKLLKNTRVFLSEKFVAGKTFADGTPISAGYYEFDEDGKMIIE